MERIDEHISHEALAAPLPVDAASISAPPIRRRPASARETIIEPPRSGLIAAWRAFIRHRQFVPYFGQVFLKKRYARTWLGMVWLPLRPSLSLGARILVFGGLIGVSSNDAPYPLFFVVATAAWQLFSEAAYWATRSLELNRARLREMHIPKITVITSAAVPSLLEFAMYVAIAVVGVVYYYVRAGNVYVSISVRTLYVPAGLLLLMALGLGVGFVTATLAASARDIRFGMQYVLSFLYFMTPVIYPISAVPPQYRPLAEINPATGAVEMVKDGLFSSHELSSDAVYVSVVAAIALWALGVWLLHRSQVRVFRES